MQALEEESKRVLKKQRLSVNQIDRQLDALLEEVQTTKQKLVEKQEELRRKKARRSDAGTHNGEPSADAARATSSGADNGENLRAVGLERTAGSSAAEESKEEDKETVVEEQDDAMEMVVRDFIRRVRLLHVEKNVAAELKSIHVLLSKYSKQIDKVQYECCCTIRYVHVCLLTLCASRTCAATLPRCANPASWTRSPYSA